MGVRPVAVAERADPERAARLRPERETEPRLRVFRKCACGGGANCRCQEEAQAPPSRESVAMLARSAGNTAVSGLIQRDDKTAAPKASSKLDEKAAAIVKDAQDTSVDESKRAVKAVQSILSTYFSGDGAMVDGVVWDADEKKGLHTDSVGTGDKTKGKISVGPYFIQNTNEAGFARRVIQVDHELEHIRQYRAGMTGKNRSDEREFLAFQREALEPEVAGTGRIGHGTRLNLIDGALGYYNCLDDDKKTAYKDKQQALLTEREAHNGKGGHPKTDPPTECKRVG